MRMIVGSAFVVGFLVAAGISGRWALMPLLVPPQGLHSGTEAELIRDRYPDRLIDPSALHMTDGESGMEWVFAETKARLLRALLGLAAYIALATWLSLWIKKRTPTNKDSDLRSP